MNSDMAYRLKKGQVQTGSTYGTVCAGDDSRLSDSRSPTGTAGGDLEGSYPNPTISTAAADAIIADHVADSDPHTQYQRESEKGQASGYAALDGSSKLDGSQQVYGTSASTACQGNDSRLSDSRAPNGSAGGDLTGTYPSPTINTDTVTFAKMQNIGTDKLVGRDTASTGDPEEIGVGGGLEFSGSTSIQRSALTGDVTASAGSNSTSIANDVVSFAKMQNIATDRLIGRDTASTGDPEEVTVTGGLEFTGSGGIQRSALTGDITASAGSNSTTIPNDIVTFAKMQNITTDRLVGRDTASTGDPEEISVGGGLEFSGASAIQRSALTGDIAASAGSNTTALGSNVVTDTKLRDSAAVSVIGRSANSPGDPADIAAGSNDTLFRRTGDALDFGVLTAGMVPTNLLDATKQAQMAQATIKGRAAAAGTGNETDLTASQVLTILGFNLPVEVAPVTLSTGSPTIVNLATGLPSWVSEITVSLDQASTNGTSDFIIQLGTAGGFVTSGYTGFTTGVVNAAATTGTAHTSGFRVTDVVTAASGVTGSLYMCRHDSSNNIWVVQGGFSRGSSTYQVSGRIALSGAITQIRITTNGGANTFDAGTGAVKYSQ